MKHQKVYARAVARIVLVSDRAAEIVARFFERREIKALEPRIFAHGRAVFTVGYDVHGGYYSDFVKKLTADATDLGATIERLSVTVARTEIPDECPRSECDICTHHLEAAS